MTYGSAYRLGMIKRAGLFSGAGQFIRQKFFNFPMPAGATPKEFGVQAIGHTMARPLAGAMEGLKNVLTSTGTNPGRLWHLLPATFMILPVKKILEATGESARSFVTRVPKVPDISKSIMGG